MDEKITHKVVEVIDEKTGKPTIQTLQLIQKVVETEVAKRVVSLSCPLSPGVSWGLSFSSSTWSLIYQQAGVHSGYFIIRGVWCPSVGPCEALILCFNLLLERIVVLCIYILIGECEKVLSVTLLNSNLNPFAFNQWLMSIMVAIVLQYVIGLCMH